MLRNSRQPQNHSLHPTPCSWWEACLWMGGYQLAQGIVLIAFLVLLITAGYGFDWPSAEDRVKLALDLNLDRSFLLVGVTSLGALFLVVPAVRLRQGPAFRQQLGCQLPTREQFIFALATIVPIAIIGDATLEFMQRHHFDFPFGMIFASTLPPTTLQHLHQSFIGVPYSVLVVAMALGPAIGEELVFRGIIGKGLVERWGLFKGTLVASLFFAIAHGDLSHAIATLPIAILMQLLYHLTKTIWIPIMVHFGNNLLAVTMTKYEIALEVSLSPAVLLAILGYLAVILSLLEVYRRTGEIPAFSRFSS